VLTTPTQRPAASPATWPFLAWAAVGAGGCLALLTALSIGIFVLPLVIAAATALLIWPASRTIAAVGTVSGLGLVPLWVAYLNRGGPGTVCTAVSGGQSCASEWSPWPWLAAGIVLLAAGIAAFAALRSRASR
jgi:hypothetical protein